MEVYWVFRVKTVYNVLGMKSGFLMAKERVAEKVFCIENNPLYNRRNDTESN